MNGTDLLVAESDTVTAGVLPLTDVRTAPTQRDVAAFVNQNGLKKQSVLESNVKIAVIFATWIGLYFVARYMSHPIAWVAIWIVQGLMLEGVGGGIHECVHDKLYRSRRANKVAGWVLSAPRLYNFPSYKASHLAHHRYTHDHKKDSEPVFDRMGLIDYLLYMVFSHLVYTLIIFYQPVFALFGRRPHWLMTDRQRRIAAIGSFVVLAQVGVVIVGFAFAPVFMLQFWLIPWVLANMITSINTQPEHFGADPNPPGSALTTTRTTYSNRFFGFLLWNNNLHTAHHLVPSLPGRSLPKLNTYIDPYIKFKGKSYTRWHASFLRDRVFKPGLRSAGSIRYWLRYGARTNPKQAPQDVTQGSGTDR